MRSPQGKSRKVQYELLFGGAFKDYAVPCEDRPEEDFGFLCYPLGPKRYPSTLATSQFKDMLWSQHIRLFYTVQSVCLASNSRSLNPYEYPCINQRNLAGLIGLGSITGQVLDDFHRMLEQTLRLKK